ncbi:hypothetical protein ABMA27_007699, partial [Loxostege sticticalis]
VMYEDISRAIHKSKTYFNVVMGDFNAKLGKRGDGELKVGEFGPPSMPRHFGSSIESNLEVLASRHPQLQYK